MLRYRKIMGQLDQRPEQIWDIFIQKSILYLFLLQKCHILKKYVS